MARRFLHAGGMTPAMIEDYFAGIVDAGAVRGGLGYYRSLPLTPPGDISRKIQVPTTLVWSDGDAFLGRKGAETTGRWVEADYRFEVIEGATHWLPDLNAEVLAGHITARVASA